MTGPEFDYEITREFDVSVDVTERFHNGYPRPEGDGVSKVPHVSLVATGFSCGHESVAIPLFDQIEYSVLEYVYVGANGRAVAEYGNVYAQYSIIGDHLPRFSRRDNPDTATKRIMENDDTSVVWSREPVSTTDPIEDWLQQDASTKFENIRQRARSNLRYVSHNVEDDEQADTLRKAMAVLEDAEYDSEGA